MTDEPEENEPTNDVDATMVDDAGLKAIQGGVTITDLETGKVITAREVDTEPTLGKPAPELGKRWKGQQFVTTKVAKSKTEEEQKSRREPNSISLSAYFVRKGVRNQVTQAAMAAYTHVRYGTVQTFDSIFAKF